MNIEAVQEVLQETEAGRMIFPVVVERLLAAGVESYRVDFISNEDTFYATSGETYREPLSLSGDTVAEEFDQAAVVAAIRGAQADTVRYPEFVRLSRAAGVAGYAAYLTGRRVVYFGRKGEMHVEHFPGAHS